jgi:hypothetical protein
MSYFHYLAHGDEMLRFEGASPKEAKQKAIDHVCKKCAPLWVAA